LAKGKYRFERDLFTLIEVRNMKSIYFIILILFFISTECMAQTLSVCGEGKGVLTPDYAVFDVVIDDADCSARFPDVQSKIKKYTEITKDYKIASSDNVFQDEKTTRMDHYEGAKDVHAVFYQLTLRDANAILRFIDQIDEDIPGAEARLNRVEFGNNNKTREAILTKAFEDAKHRAETLAQQGNSKIGKMLSIKEERFNEESSVLETLFNADKKYKKDAYAYAFSQIFPSFNILIRVEFELIPN